MKLPGKLLLVALLVAAMARAHICFAQSQTAPYDKATDAPVLIVLGQSNAEGYTQSLSGSDLGRVGVHLPNVHGLSRQNNLLLTNTDVTWDGYAVNGYNLGDGVDQTYNLAGEFAKLWQDAITNETRDLPDLYVIQISWGGQGILASESGGNNRWYPGGPSVAVENLYPLANRIVGLAMQNLIRAGKTPRLVGLHWNQWEEENQTGGIASAADAVDKYTSFFNGFEQTLGGAAFPIYLYRPRSTLYTRQVWQNDSKHFDDLVSGFTQLSQDPRSNVRLIDAAESTDTNGVPYYNSADPSYAYGIFNPSDTVHYLGKVQQWFARKQWDQIFSQGLYGGGISSVNVPPPLSHDAKHFGQKIDFDGDRKSDFLFTNGTNDYVVWQMLGLGWTNAQLTSVPTTSTDWAVLTEGDFDGDTRTDILWLNKVSGQYAIWFMNGNTVQSGALMTQPAVGWTVIGTGDFDADRKTDLIFYNASTNQYVIWFMNGAAPRSDNGLIQTPDAGFNFEAVGDFNHDGTSDILWKNSSSGQYVIWNMSGLAIAASGLMTQPAPGWAVLAVADFDADGTADILWFDVSSTQYVIWYMNGGFGIRSSGLIQTPSDGWLFQGTGDYDGDGKADILWFNPVAGQYAIWFITGFAMDTRSGLMSQPADGWYIAH